MNIEQLSTKELVDELINRDGVEVTIAEPHEDCNISVNGPATILTIID